jgi:hypothetical protein
MEALVLKRSRNISKGRTKSDGIWHTVTGHARLARNTGGDEDNLSVRESLLQSGRSRVIAGNGAVGVDVAEISSDTCRQNQSIGSDEYATATEGDLPGPPRIS